MDELMVQELSATGAAYLAGTVHLFMGNTSENFSETADWTSEGVSNERLGWMFASAGDVNDDGFTDTFIGSSMGFTPSGQINLYLGSSNGFVSTTETIRTGSPADYLGAITLGGFDSQVRILGFVGGVILRCLRAIGKPWMRSPELRIRLAVTNQLCSDNWAFEVV